MSSYETNNLYLDIKILESIKIYLMELEDQGVKTINDAIIKQEKLIEEKKIALEALQGAK